MNVVGGGGEWGCWERLGYSSTRRAFVSCHS